MSTMTLAQWIQRLRSSILVTAFLLALLVGVGPLQSLSLRPPETQAQTVEICDRDNPSASLVVQDCDLRSDGFAMLENAALADILAISRLPASDEDRILAWERNLVRARVFDQLIAIIRKAPEDRTEHEQRIVNSMAEVVRQRRIAAAEFSIQQYELWVNDPCNYEAPHGFEYEKDQPWCNLPFTQILTHPEAPTLEDFLHYGYAESYKEFQDDGEAGQISAETVKMLGVIGGFTLVGIAAAVGWVLGGAAAMGSGIVAALHPHLLIAYAISVGAETTKVVAGTAAGITGALSIAAVLAIVVLAIVIAIFEAISLIETLELPNQLQEVLNHAHGTVDLQAIEQSNEGKGEIYAAFILATLPAFPNEGFVPAAQATDRTFVVTDPQGNQTQSPTINYQCWNPRHCQGEDVGHSARLHDGWFVDMSDTSGTERMTLDIDYIDWNGEGWTATRTGSQEFLHTRTGDDDAVEFVSTEIRYVDPSGAQMIAAINQPPAAPPTPIANDTVNNGTFGLDWAPGTTDADGDPVTYTLFRCDESEIVFVDGVANCTESMVATDLTATNYAFTVDAPEEAGLLKYRVVASDAESEGESSAWSEPVLVDQKAPEITLVSRTPEANGNRWNNTDVTVEWTCTDVGGINVDPSGVVSETVSEMVTTEGANQSVTGVCEDNAGNTASYTVGSISIDKTAPTADIGGPYSIEEGSSIQFSSAAANASDALSGIVSAAFALDGDNQYDDGDPATFVGIDDSSQHQIRLRVEDRAGNVTIAGTTLLVTNAAPSVNPPVVDIEPSDEGQSVIASAAFNDPGTLDTHSCTVDYGDGSGPQAGTISGNTCTGPAHIYEDDDPSGTASDDYTVEIVVTDSDGSGGDNSSAHTVNNVAPVINRITTNGPVVQGISAQISVSASDVGVNDVLSYRFDCDGDGVYEAGPQASADATCSLDPATATTTVGVQVSDDDGGVVTGTVDVEQTVTMCLNYWDGSVGPATASGGCPSGSAPQVLPSANPMAFCLNVYTGAIRWSSSGSCPSGQMVHLVPTSGPLSYCQNFYTGGMRYSWNGNCSASERPGVIPG